MNKTTQSPSILEFLDQLRLHLGEETKELDELYGKVLDEIWFTKYPS